MNRLSAVGVGALLAACLLASTLQGQEQAVSWASRLPVPDAATLKDAQKLVNDLFKDDLAKAKGAKEKGELARKLLQSATETKNDPAGKYALLVMATDLAVEAVAAETTWSAAAEMAITYDVDTAKLRSDTLSRLVKSARTTEDCRALAAWASAMLDRAVARDNCDLARQFAEAAHSAARQSKDLDLMKETGARVQEITEIETALGQAKKALEKLAADPNDPEANLTAGKFLCFAKDDWAKGLAMLALGSDAKLKALAEKDLAKPTEGDKQAEVADGWWEVGEKEKTTSQNHIREHAAQLYARALPSLAGLAKAKAEKRLEALATSATSRTGTAKELTLNLGNNVTMKLVLIPAGKFMMGSPENQRGHVISEGPQREVTISKPFYMGVYEVTQEQYGQVMGENPSRFKGAKNPVEMVSWDAAVKFCASLSKKSGKTVQLPTEAQWEYACRAGSRTRFCDGDADRLLGDYAWYGGNSDKTTHPVGEKKVNAWGLYDMHGNVWEWCQDWCVDDYYSKGENVDPTGPATGADRVLRGGSWHCNPQRCRSAYRGRLTPDDRFITYGLRVVVPVGPGL